uniref:Nodal n=1 Tax=Phallusia mammillata TaxID=59560 RepID=A0A6F9DMX6_9ASCI|nr:nodal [Phallusia mammillata]
MDMTQVSFCIAIVAFLLSCVHPSANGANLRQQIDLESSQGNLFTDLRDSEVLSPPTHISDEHPTSAARPSAPSPPKMASRTDHAVSYDLDSSMDAVPQHMRDFHSRVLKHIHAASESQTDDLATKASSEFMLSLYHHQETESTSSPKDINSKQGKALKKSDIVRSFSAIESYKQADTWVIVFDLSAILQRERIRLSELNLKVPRDYNDVTKIELIDERATSEDGVTTLSRRKIASTHFNARQMPTSQKVSIDITRMIRRWYNENEKRTDKSSEQETIDDLVNERSGLSDENPTLFVFSSNKQLDLIETVAAHQTRSRRSSATRGQRKVYKGRSGKRKSRKLSRKRNKTDKSRRLHSNSDSNRIEENVYQYDMVSTNSLEFGTQIGQKKKTDSRVTDEVMMWKKEQSEVRVVATKKTTHESESKKSPVKPNPFGFSFRFRTLEPIEPTHCRLVPFEVDFEKIGWGSWIVHPKKYNANRCVGHCRNPTVHGAKPTNHAYLQSILSNQHDSNVPEPCCVPTKLKPISLLYLQDGEVHQQQHQDMVVTECGCR